MSSMTPTETPERPPLEERVEPKPCPFSGEPAEFKTFTVEIPGYTRTQDCATSDLVGEWLSIECWNRRPIEDEKDARIATLEAQLAEAGERVKELEGLLQVFVDHDVDYMTRNNLGDPNEVQRIRQALAILHGGEDG